MRNWSPLRWLQVVVLALTLWFVLTIVARAESIPYAPCTLYRYYNVQICGDYPFQYNVYVAMLRVVRGGYLPYVRNSIALIEQVPSGTWPGQFAWVTPYNTRARVQMDFTQSPQSAQYDYLSMVLVHEAAHARMMQRGIKACGGVAEHNADIETLAFARRVRLDWIVRNESGEGGCR